MSLQVPAKLSNENVEAISNYLPYRVDMRKSWSVIEALERKEFEYIDTKHFTQSHLNQQEKVIQKIMSKMRCKSASPGGLIFDVSVPQKKLIQPFTAAEATKQVEKGMLGRLTLGRMYMERHVTKYSRRFTTSRKETRAKWKRIHIFKPEKRSEKPNTRRENEKLDTIQCLKLEMSRMVSGSSSVQRGLLIKQTPTIPFCLANKDTSLYNSGGKSQDMKLFEDSYPNAFSDCLEFSPDWIITELMMLIHVAPRSHKTFGDWGEFLWSIYISFAGSTVCLLGDRLKKNNIKSLERQRR